MSNLLQTADIIEETSFVESILANEKTFADFNLNPFIAKAITYTIPTAIQQMSIPPIMEKKDILGCAQTGSGKTAAFVLPILHLLAERFYTMKRGYVRTLILAPTRELATQIYDSCRTYGAHLPNLRYAIVVGGVRQQPQVRSLAQGVDILVGTPGRVLDLIRQRQLTLEKTEILVLDEADHMMDIGFIDAVRTMVDMIPNKRHTLFFSATMPKEIAELADEILFEPVTILAPKSDDSGKIEQMLHYVRGCDKFSLLLELLKEDDTERAIIFTSTKQRADEVVDKLYSSSITSDSIHSDKSQHIRQRTLKGFKNGQFRILVATDIAARGIDIDGINLVINYDLPRQKENYIHRIGRTARGGRNGKAFSFCDPQEDYKFVLPIERALKHTIPVNMEHSFHPKDWVPGQFMPRKKGSGSSSRFRPRSGESGGYGGGERSGGYGARSSGGGYSPRTSQGGEARAPYAPREYSPRTGGERSSGGFGGGERRRDAAPGGPGSFNRSDRPERIDRSERSEVNGNTTSYAGRKPYTPRTEENRDRREYSPYPRSSGDGRSELNSSPRGQFSDDRKRSFGNESKPFRNKFAKSDGFSKDKNQWTS